MFTLLCPGTRWPGGSLLGLVFLFAASQLHADFFRFAEAGPITASASQSRLSRTPSGNLVCDASGVFHLVYTDWADSGVQNVFVNTPEAPSRIFYTRLSGRLWSAPERVNNGTLPDGREIGGGHPSLLVRADGEVVVFWHDARHCSQAGNFIDNYEIYLDRRPPEGSFSPLDERLTVTGAGHNGDNGYSPQGALAADGRLLVAWHDFFADGGISDIYLHRSDAAGQFPALPMPDLRRTMYQPGSGRGAFWHSALAEDAAGLLHLVWTEGIPSTAPLWSLTLSATGEPLALDRFSSTGSNNLDPPRLARSPLGNLYAVWSDRRHGNGEIYAARLIGGSTGFSDFRRITLDGAVSQHPDVAVDESETLHIVWSDNRDRNYEIFYCTYRFTDDRLTETRKLTLSGGRAEHPAIKLSPDGRCLVVYEDNRSGTGQLYALLGAATSAVSVRRWETLR